MYGGKPGNFSIPTGKIESKTNKLKPLTSPRNFCIMSISKSIHISNVITIKTINENMDPSLISAQASAEYYLLSAAQHSSEWDLTWHDSAAPNNNKQLSF